MKINAIDVKPGNVLEHQGKLWLVVKRELIQPGKGGAFAQIEMRDLRARQQDQRALPHPGDGRARPARREGDAVPLFRRERRRTFMDNESFEQITVDRDMIGEPADFLREGMICTIELYEGEPLSVTIPQTVVMEVVEADPVVKGQTASSSYKPGKLENGRRVMLPPHIGAGTRIVVNTADGSYVERAKD